MLDEDVFAPCPHRKWRIIPLYLMQPPETAEADQPVPPARNCSEVRSIAQEQAGKREILE